jgi:hypothetical protein
MKNTAGVINSKPYRHQAGTMRSGVPEHVTPCMGPNFLEIQSKLGKFLPSF